jgi:signal transduction histidine kinase
VRNSIKAVGYHSSDIDHQLAEAAELIHAGPGSGNLAIAVVANDGSLIARSTDFPLSGTGDLTAYKVLKSPDWLEFQFPEILAGEISCGGELLLPTGARPGILIATDYSPADSWQVVVLSRTDGIEDALHVTKLYLLISFLSLALLLVVLILLFYLSLAAGLSSAINSAVALEEATVRFQESVGEFRRPLHNIQGLADMLEITEDPEERTGYLREIKGEVGRIIKGLETSEP